MGTSFEVRNNRRRPPGLGPKEVPMPSSSVAEKVVQQQQLQTPDWTALGGQVTAAVASSLATPSSLASSPDDLRAAIDQAVVEGLGLALQSAAERWADDVVGAGRYERSSGRVGLRSGARQHVFHFAVGPVTISVPKPRSGTSRPSWVPALKRAPERFKALVRELWVRGLSSRDLSSVSDQVVAKSWSHGSMANWVRDVADETLRWLNRPVRPDIRYLVLDGLYVPVVRSSSQKEALLVALGITEDGHKEILEVMHAPTESVDSWATLLSRLKMRGLPVKDLSLVITDGNNGVRGALEMHLPTVRRQRYTVHKVRNVVGRSSKALKKYAPREASNIYKAPSRSEALRRAQAFIAKYSEIAPKLAAIVEDDLDACLAFYDFDASRWRGLCSTNALERMNREFRRKLREVGAMKAEVNVTRVAVTVARFVNEEVKDKPVAGFRQKRRRN